MHFHFKFGKDSRDEKNSLGKMHPLKKIMENLTREGKSSDIQYTKYWHFEFFCSVVNPFSTNVPLL